ncbi:hypothetical protein BDA96_07G190900 [Sorghum bicolor]|uniref:Uncharacterized protein n=1 Tax=Sorghum bicolor TaxID=4558 RepID=A0A921QLV4_SORBI|nr:hypothetical protein BDA96_07G190900 [Sorghum bicolor]
MSVASDTTPDACMLRPNAGIMVSPKMLTDQSTNELKLPSWNVRIQLKCSKFRTRPARAGSLSCFQKTLWTQARRQAGETKSSSLTRMQLEFLISCACVVAAFLLDPSPI